MPSQMPPVVFVATGKAAQYSVALEAYEAQSDAPSWWPARLTIAQEAAETSFKGRVHGLAGSSHVTFSALVARRGDRHVHADLLRGRLPLAGERHFQATFVAPNAAAHVRRLLHLSSSRGMPERQVVVAKEEAARIRSEYGVAFQMSIVVAFDPAATRASEARRADASPHL